MSNSKIDMTTTLSDGGVDFKVLKLGDGETTHTVLFAAGRGGDPMRHLALLQVLADKGCTIIAPHFEMMASPFPTEEELTSRAHRLIFSVQSLISGEASVAGIGHSIGATLLLGLAGGKLSTQMGKLPAFSSTLNFDRLALFAPATDFFRAPGALDAVHTDILAWAGEKDTITPPVQITFLKDALPSGANMKMRLAENAGHFTFMNELPPHIEDTHPDRDAFLANLTDEVTDFVL